MSETEPTEAEPTQPVDDPRRRLQKLFASGWLTLAEYNELGRLHGFVGKAPVAARALQLGGWGGVALLALSVLARVASARYPELREPLELLNELGNLFVGAP